MELRFVTPDLYQLELLVTEVLAHIDYPVRTWPRSARPFDPLEFEDELSAERAQEILREDWNGGEAVMVERYIPGRELTCAVMGDVALGVTEIVTDLSFYSYEAKYVKGGSNHLIPAPVSSKIYDKVQKMSLKAHAALGCRGVTRADFRFNDAAGVDGELVCLELNTQPGMTETSLVPEQARHAGHSFEELVSWMVEDASCNR